MSSADTQHFTIERWGTSRSEDTFKNAAHSLCETGTDRQNDKGTKGENAKIGATFIWVYPRVAGKKRF